MQPIPAPPPPTRRFSLTKHPIRRALDSARPSVQDMGVDLRRAHVTVPEQFLNRADIMAVFQQVRGERVTEGVAARRFGDPRATDRVLDRALQHGFVEMVPSPLSSDAVDI